MRHLPILALSLFATTGCLASGDDDSDDPENDSFVTGDGKSDVAGIRDESPEAIGVLALVNNATVERLAATGISKTALKNIDAHRKGADKYDYTADDNAFDDLKELDDVPYVGTTVFKKLLAYARNTGFVSPLPDTPGLCGDALTSVRPLRTESNEWHDEVFLGAMFYRTRVCEGDRCDPWGVLRRIGEPEDTWIQFDDRANTSVTTFEPTFHRAATQLASDGTSVDTSLDITFFVHVQTLTPVGIVAPSAFGQVQSKNGSDYLSPLFASTDVKLTDKCLRAQGVLKTDAGVGNYRYEDEYTFVGLLP